jgi:hypothetical protein
MGFNPGSGGSGSIAGSTDVFFDNVTGGQVLTYESTNQLWTNATHGPAVGDIGTVLFDSFAGANDSAKVASMNDWMEAQGTNKVPVVLFGARSHSISTPIKLFSGLKLQGAAGLPAREYARTSTIVNWTGGSGTSLFIFPPEGQTNQSFAVDNDSPRDITVIGIQFSGGSSTHFMPKLDPSGGGSTGQGLWNSCFHNCGWKNFGTVWWGWGFGAAISGLTHVQALSDTAFYLGGSGNQLFGMDAHSFLDTPPSSVMVSGATGKPHIRSIMDSSVIGNVMITARQTLTCLSVEGGSGLRVMNTSFDAQDSDPMSGTAMRISGGDGITVSNCSFKGAMDDPSAGGGGETNNRGYLHITGGTNIVIEANQFLLGGTSAGSSTPAIYAASSVADNAVKVGMNGYASFANPTVLRQAAANKILSIDPRTSVTTQA